MGRSPAFLGLLVAAALVRFATAGEIRGGNLLLRYGQTSEGVTLGLIDARGLDYADGLAGYVIETAGGDRRALASSVTQTGPGSLEILAQAAGLEVRHSLRIRSASDGFEERITVVNTSTTAVEVADYHFALRRTTTARGRLRAVAIPFRRQADGKLHDYALEEIAAGRAGNSDWTPEPSVIAPPLADSGRGRLRSEAWCLTDGRAGLLIAKYNNEDIEYSHLAPVAGRARQTAPVAPDLLIGGSSYALYREPESMHRLLPGKPVSLGTTYYIGVDGGWPAAYDHYKSLLDGLGHGLTADYNPPINWNELFDVGWYHSDAAALATHYTRDALLREAAKAAEIGATVLYLDPGWEVCEGTTRWAEDRLGTTADLVHTLRDRFGIDLAFRTIGRVYRDEFPRDWYIRRVAGRPYDRPPQQPLAEVEPVPRVDDRGCRNIALLPSAVATASSCISGYAIHRTEHLNDGWYNNPASWISAGEPSWVQIDLGEAHTIDRVRLGSEHTPWHRDRAPLHVRILATGEAAPAPSWRLLAEHADTPISGTRTFAFEPQVARQVRVEIAGAVGGTARIDEIEIYEVAPHPWRTEPRTRRIDSASTQPQGAPIAFWEVCTQHPAWQAEKLRRIEQIAAAGMKFIMFDEFDWRGPCCDPDHGHVVPSTPEGHVRAVYGLVRETKRRVPGLLVEAHDPVWPWGVRYLPVYFDQTLDPARRAGSYDENWGFEFMWNPIEDLVSGRALCLYYYNLGCDIPLYDHITAENDNDACLAFWWYASTVRHLGIGGKKGLGGKAENETRWQAYKQAMVTYRRLREYFVRGGFIGIDELTHLHVLPDRKGGVLVAFNLLETPVERDIELDPTRLGLDRPPTLADARLATGESGWRLSFSIPPRSPRIIELGIPER